MPTSSNHLLHRWTRRRVLTAGAAAAGLASLRLGAPGSALAFAAAPCTLTPELEEGPFYADYELLRNDIREGKPGLPLHLSIVLQHARTCAPISGAAIDIWHCDALGIYSGYTKVKMEQMGAGGPPGGPDGQGGPPPGGPPDGMQGPPPDFNGGGDHHGPPGMGRTDNETFLRGVQLSGTDGSVGFLTIYPGWYVMRDTHIHVKVHIGGSEAGKKYAGGHVCHTGQIAFPDELSDRVGQLEPYAQHKVTRTRMTQDMVFHGDADTFTLALTQLDAKNLAAGFRGVITLAVDPDATPAPTGPGGPGGPGGPRPGGQGQSGDAGGMSEPASGL
ncbi:intradiol ring-cleavage dioxygenase [Silvibacterium dinghuense]|uniref:Dioxygenase n=1 Tax=Silvibacterium dinghuense TaxID=1560006 RepID=A0A4Q1SI42_9BACT|nr:intradiol ring-cleavage dioxygenase [Silvibacterium dinghuense]RXS97033.1 dioxygenase [Silvibacterium dinghuense]